MPSKPTAGHAASLRVTRRAIVAGAPAATIGGTNGAVTLVGAVGSDETIARCTYWLGLYVELDYLMKRYGELEEHLSQTYSWLRLSKEQRRTRPEGEEFRRVEARMNEICALRPVIMEEASTLKATTPAAILAKLALAQQLVWPDDYPEAHDLIASCVRELSGMLPHITFRPPQV